MKNRDSEKFFVVGKKVIWNCIDETHKAVIRDFIEKFDARVKLIKSGDKIFFNRSVQ